MNDRQILKLWKKLDNGVSVRDAVSDVKGKSGYGRERTLRRYAQVLQGFKEELESEVIEKKTGLSVKLIDRLRNLWKQKHQKEIQDRQKPGGKILLEEEPGNRRALRRIVRRWRRELAASSPSDVLQMWVDKTYEVAQSRFFTNEDIKTLYAEARQSHPLQVRPPLQVQSDPTFVLLRQRVPASNVWVAFQAWCEQRVQYVNAFYSMLKEVERVVLSAIGTLIAEFDKEDIKGVDWIDGDDFSGFTKRCRMERLLTVFVICDLLACRIAKLPSSTYWGRLINDLENLRLKINVELFTLTGIAPRGGWPSGIMDILGASPDRPLEQTAPFLHELAKLRPLEDSLTKALNELESEI